MTDVRRSRGFRPTRNAGTRSSDVEAKATSGPNRLVFGVLRFGSPIFSPSAKHNGTGAFETLCFWPGRTDCFVGPTASLVRSLFVLFDEQTHRYGNTHREVMLPVYELVTTTATRYKNRTNGFFSLFFFLVNWKQRFYYTLRRTRTGVTKQRIIW